MRLATEGAVSAEFRRLFEAEFGYVCRALQRLGVHRADLPDVAQELFVAVHAHLGEYDRARPVRPWLYSFALRFAANYRRLARHRDVPIEPASHAGEAADHEARDLVLRALSNVEFERRVVLVMHDLEGFPVPEIAERLHVPLNTTYSRLRLARAEFRAAIDRLRRGDAP